MLLLFILIGTALPAHAAPAPVAERPQALGERLKGLQTRLAELDSKIDGSSLIRALVALSQAAPASKEAAELERRAAPILEEHRKATSPLIFEMTLLARRLEEYKRTGRLPPDVPDRERLKRFLEDPWPKGIYPWKPTPLRLPQLELDIGALERQLRPLRDLSGLAPRVKRSAEPPLGASPAEPPPKAATAPEPRLELDAGRGRAESDPIPGLLELLSSEDAFQRALAADELGMRGRNAAAAVPGLRAALGDPDPRVRGSAALSLGGIGGLPPEAVDEIRRLLQDTDSDVRFSAKTALERLSVEPRPR